jgi:hypothetical protein
MYEARALLFLMVRIAAASAESCAEVADMALAMDESLRPAERAVFQI